MLDILSSITPESWSWTYILSFSHAEMLYSRQQNKNKNNKLTNTYYTSTGLERHREVKYRECLLLELSSFLWDQ